MPRKNDIVVQMIDDKWYLEKFDRHECCDCGLVHKVEYQVENGRLFTRWARADDETKKVRKALKIKVSRG